MHFLHGNGFSGGVYWPFLRELLTDGPVITHDLEGHGESDRPTAFSGGGALIRRVPQVMDDIGLPQTGVVGMGHSFGGALTLKLADRQPERYRALVLLDPILLPKRYWWGSKLASWLGRNPMSNGARRRRAVWSDRATVRSKLAGRGIYRGWTDEALDHFIDHATRDAPEGRTLNCPTWLEATIFENPFYPWPAVARLRLPTLLLYGRDSYPFFPATVRRVARLAPQVVVQALPGGHCFMQEDPSATANAIRAFLKTV